jgi:hypothetical protein
MKKSCRVPYLIVQLTVALLVDALVSPLGIHPAHATTLKVTATTSTIPIIQITAPDIHITNGSVYAGSAVPAFLDGTALPFLYCVDILRDIYIPGTYSTTFTFNGMVHGKAVVNMEQVAWLLDKYASAAASDSTKMQTAALQAAIWQVIYGDQFTLTGGPSTVLSQYNTYMNAFHTALLTGGGTASVTNYAWLSPVSPVYGEMQGLVTRVPELSSTLLLALALSGLFGVGWWHHKRSQE